MRTKTLVTLAVALLVSDRSAAQSIGSASDTGRTVVYSTGQARQPIPLDRVTIVLTIDTQAMNVEDAASRLATIERGVADTLRRFNLPAGSVQTFAGGITPYRPQNGPPSMMSGPTFAGRSTIRVEGLRPEQLAPLTAAALAKGATGVAAPTFSSSVMDSVRRTLVPKAFELAKRDAENVARAAGGQLGRLLTISIAPAALFEQQQPYVTPMYYENSPRVLPNASASVNVNASWILIPGARQ